MARSGKPETLKDKSARRPLVLGGLFFLLAGGVGLVLGLPGGARPLSHWSLPDADGLVLVADIEELRSGVTGMLAGASDLGSQLAVGAARGLASSRLGFDPLDAKAFAELGVDPRRGALFVSAGEGCGYLVVGVARHDLLRRRLGETIEHLGLAREAGGDPEVDRFIGGSEAMVLRFVDDDLLIAGCGQISLFGSRKDMLPRAAALLDRVRALVPAESLASREPGFDAACEAVAPASGVLYVPTRGLAAAGQNAAKVERGGLEAVALGIALEGKRLDLVGYMLAPTAVSDLKAVTTTAAPPEDLLAWVPRGASSFARLSVGPRELLKKLREQLPDLTEGMVTLMREQAVDLGLDWNRDLLDNLSGQVVWATVPVRRSGLFGLGRDAGSREFVAVQVLDVERTQQALKRAVEKLASGLSLKLGQMTIPSEGFEGLWRLEGKQLLMSMYRDWLAELKPGAGPLDPLSLPPRMRERLAQHDASFVYLDLSAPGLEGLAGLGRVAGAVVVDTRGLRVEASFMPGRVANPR